MRKDLEILQNCIDNIDNLDSESFRETYDSIVKPEDYVKPIQATNDLSAEDSKRVIENLKAPNSESVKRLERVRLIRKSSEMTSDIINLYDKLSEMCMTYQDCSECPLNEFLSGNRDFCIMLEEFAVYIKNHKSDIDNLISTVLTH